MKEIYITDDEREKCRKVADAFAELYEIENILVVAFLYFWTRCPEARRNIQMESMRDINRVMEREIAKGSCPLKLDHIEFGDYSYQEITSKEKLLEVLSYLLRIGDFKQYAGKTILNNVYMDLRGKKPVFKRTKTAMERNNIFATIRRYAKKLKPQYNGDVYLETVRCYFDIPQENLEKCRYTYQGNETYAFLMSDKYIMALYTHCLVVRKEAAVQVLLIIIKKLCVTKGREKIWVNQNVFIVELPKICLIQILYQMH